MQRMSQLTICIPIYFLVNYSDFLRFYNRIFFFIFFMSTSVVTRYMIGNRKHEGGEAMATLIVLGISYFFNDFELEEKRRSHFRCEQRSVYCNSLFLCHLNFYVWPIFYLYIFFYVIEYCTCSLFFLRESYL
jgi:hypothetical protein